MLNISAASAPHKNNIRVVSDTISQKMIRLSSGKRINFAADDASGLAVSSKMIAQIMQKGMAARNIADMQSAITVAMQSAKTSQDIVQRIRELTVRAASAVISQSIVDIEIESLLAELEKVSANAALNGKLVSNGAFNEDVSLGNQDGNFSVNLPNFSPDELGMVDNSSSVTAIYHTAANTNEITGSTFPLTVDSGSAAQTLSLDLSSIDPIFGYVNTFVTNHPNGTFKLKNIEVSGIGAKSSNLTINPSGNLQLSSDGSGNIQNYNADLIYTGADGRTYTLKLKLIDDNTPAGNTAFAQDYTNRRQEDISARINLAITADGSDTTIDYLTIGTGVTQNTNARAEWDDQYSHFWDLAGYRTLGVHPADPLGGNNLLNAAKPFEVVLISDNNGGLDNDGISVDSTGVLSFSNKLPDGNYVFDLIYRDINGDTFTTTVDLVVNNTAPTLSNFTSFNSDQRNESIDLALSQINQRQARMGALFNRLEYSAGNTEKSKMLTQIANGRIEDADFACETIELTKSQILEKSSQQSLANFVSDRTKQLKTILLSTETLSDKLT